MKKFFRKLRKNEDGVVSVEFALIAPMLIFATLFSINLGYQVNNHQKVASSIAAGTNFLQDFALEESVDQLRPNFDSQNGNVSDTNLIATLKEVIQSAHGDSLSLDEIFVETYCACPNNNPPAGEGDGSGSLDPNLFEIATEQSAPDSDEFDFSEPDRDFYTRTNVSLIRRGELCAYDCPNDGGRARVIMEVEVYHNIVDLFGKEIVIREQLKTRIR